MIPYPTITDQEENRFSLRDWPVNSSNVVTLEPGEDFDFRIGLTPKAQTVVSALIFPIAGPDFVVLIKGEANAGEAEISYSPSGGASEVIVNNGDGTPTPFEGTNFGNLDVGRPGGTDPYRFNPTETHRFILRNRSTIGDTLITGAPRIPGSDGNSSPHFSITNYSTGRGNPLASTGLDIFEITNDPMSTGLHIATFSLETNDLDDPTYTFTLLGGGLTSGQLNVVGRSETTSPLRDVVDGSTIPSVFNGTILPATSLGTSTTRAFRMISTGSGPLEFSGQPTSSNPAFVIEPISTADLAPNPQTGRDLSVVFTPTERGLQYSDITIETNDPDNSPYTFTIVANGTGPELVVKGTGNDAVVRDIPNSSGTLPNPDYGTQLGTVDSGAPSVTREFILRNRGNQSAVISNVSLTGPHAGDFNLSGINATTQTYQFQVSATVNDPNPASGAITVQGKPSTSSSFREVSPEGGRPITSNGTLFFDPEVDKSSTSNFRVVNKGDAPLRIARFLVEGANRGEFEVKPIPSGSITPEKFTDFSIRFTPAKNTSAGITVVISTDDPKIPTFRFAVSGTGVEPGEDPLPPTRINRFALNGAEATITLVAETGKRFVVTTSSSLEEGSWTPFPGLEEIVGNGSVRTLRITDFLLPGGPAQRFIRLEELE
ncbi:MAG: choice-of-anchor D domain-containing protein [Akkermansiaceae bacterium]